MRLLPTYPPPPAPLLFNPSNMPLLLLENRAPLGLQSPDAVETSASLRSQVGAGVLSVWNPVAQLSRNIRTVVGRAVLQLKSGEWRERGARALERHLAHFTASWGLALVGGAVGRAGGARNGAVFAAW